MTNVTRAEVASFKVAEVWYRRTPYNVKQLPHHLYRTYHTTDVSGTSQLVTRSARHTVKSCDELTVLFDLASVAFKSIAVVGDSDIAHIKPE